MIRIEHIHKKFRKLPVLQDISVNLVKGQVIALIGPNGSGKTTLVKSILGMVRPDSGNIYFNDKLIRSDYQYRENIGYMPQIGRYPDNMKVGQLFAMLKKFRGEKNGRHDEEMIREFKLDAIQNKTMRTLSGGTRQKVSAAVAFLFSPEVLILDEPTAGLDPLSSDQLKEKILREKSQNKLIIITSHILSDLDELTTHVMYLQEGRMRFMKDIRSIREETGEQRLEKAIAAIMRGEEPRIEKKTSIRINEIVC